MVHYIADRFRARAARDPGDLSRLVRRHPPGRRRDGAGVRPPAGRQVRDAAAVRERRVGDLLDARPARAAVQAGHPARARTSSTRSSTAPRSRSGQASAPTWPREAARHERPDRRRDATAGRAARPHDARPRALGGHARSRPSTGTATQRVVEAVAEAAYQSAERFADRGGARRPGWASPSTSGARTRRARAASSSATRSATTSTPASTPTRKIVEVPQAGRRRARAHAVDQPDRHRLLQGAAGADDAQRGRRVARTRSRARVLRRRRPRCSPRPPSPPARPTAACRWSRSRRSR